MPTQNRKIFVIPLLIFFVVTACVFTYLAFIWNRNLNDSDHVFSIAQGQSLSAVALQLKKAGILKSHRNLVALAYLKGQGRQIKIGEYKLQAGSNIRQLLHMITSGKVIQYPLVLIEGWTFKQFMAALRRAPKLKHTLQGMSDAQIMEQLGYIEQHPEGRFYPDTYQYTYGMTDAMILKQAYKRMSQHLDQQWQDRDHKLPVNTPYEALILASIIEKETGKANERRDISAVFTNRLRMHMRLQTDPTVIYGMGVAYKGSNIRIKDLRKDTPYNTYTRYGLPPTPIAMPGKDSLHAALHPSDSKALYFVGRGDGSHQFSRTLKEHNRAVIKYQVGGKPKNLSSNQKQKR